jgi:hypothetical protein
VPDRVRWRRGLPAAKVLVQSQLHGSYEICFHWELWYETILQLVEGEHWYSTWVLQMPAYKRTGNSEVELMALQSVHKHFREACMDFERLWGLACRHALHRQCARPGSTRVADGIMVSCKNALMRMYAPFLPKQPPVREFLVQVSRLDGILAEATLHIGGQAFTFTGAFHMDEKPMTLLGSAGSSDEAPIVTRRRRE